MVPALFESKGIADFFCIPGMSTSCTVFRTKVLVLTLSISNLVSAKRQQVAQGSHPL